MYIVQVDRPKSCLDDHHPKGTNVTLQLTYGEMVLLEHALCAYKDQNGLNEEDKEFYWQFHALRDVLKEGSITSWIAQHYAMLFPDSAEKYVKYSKEKKE